MFELSNLPATSAGVFVSLGALALGYPAWALAYVILAFGVYIYLQR
jgi:hypothetical protein